MSRNVNAPNTIRSPISYLYRAGRTNDPNIFCRNTEGYLSFISGASCGLLCTIAITGATIPEIPDLQILKSHDGFVPWTFIEVKNHKTKSGNLNFSSIIFELDDNDSSYLQQMVIFYDFLYGTPN